MELFSTSSTEAEKSNDYKGPSLYYVSKGWMRSKNWQFLLTFSTIYADVGWVGQKRSKNVLM